MDKKDYISVALARKAQGIKGEIKISVFLDRPTDIKNISSLYADFTAQEYKVERVFCVGSDFAVKLEGIDSVDKANAFKGKQLYAKRAEIEKFKANEIYIADLLNKKAVLNDGEVLGVIDDVQNFGSSDVIYIKSEKYKNLSFANVGNIIIDVSEDKVTLDKANFLACSVYDD